MTGKKNLSDISEPAPKSGARWVLGLGVVGAVLAMGIIVAAQLRLLGEAQLSLALRLSLVDWGPWIVFTPLVLWLSARVTIDGKTWRSAVPVHLVASVLITIAYGATVAALQPVLLKEIGQIDFSAAGRLAAPSSVGVDGANKSSPQRTVLSEHRFKVGFGVFHMRLAMPIYWVLVAAWHAWANHRRSADRERRALRAEVQLSQARLIALQAQLQPHFLFNSLNAISSLVYEDPRAADEMICQLSTLLRRVLDQSGKLEITLRDELSTADCYLAVQLVRFGDKLTVRRDIDPSSLEAAVPTLLLQPLLENVFVHGLDPVGHAGLIDLRARRLGARLILEVEDNGVAPTDHAPVHEERFGLGHIRARLEEMFGGECQFEHGPRPEGGFRVHVQIPFRPISSRTP